MTTCGLTPDGFRPKRASEVRTSIQERIVDELDARGLPTDVDFERDTIAGVLVDALSTVIGEAWEAAGAVYDATDPSSATRQALDNVGGLRGIRRQPASRGLVDVTLFGEVGAVLPAGIIVQGGGPDGDARWVTLEGATLNTGAATVPAQAEEPGRILAAAGEIDEIVTALAGLNSVTNAAEATPGRDVERDAEYRLRQRRDIRVVGGRSVGAIRAALLELDAVQSVFVLENRAVTTEEINGVDLDGNSILPVIFPADLPDAIQVQVAQVLWDWGPAGAQVGRSPTNGGTDNEVTVEGDGIEPTPIGWLDATALPVDVDVELTLDPGVLLGDVESQVEAAVDALFPPLAVGDPVRLLQVLRAIGEIEGIAGASVELNGSAADVVPTALQLATAGTITVSEA